MKREGAEMVDEAALEAVKKEHDLINYRLDDLESRVKSHGKQLDTLMIDESRITTVLDRLEKSVAALEKTVGLLEKKPGNRFEQLMSILATAGITCIVTYVITTMLA